MHVHRKNVTLYTTVRSWSGSVGASSVPLHHTLHKHIAVIDSYHCNYVTLPVVHCKTIIQQGNIVVTEHSSCQARRLEQQGTITGVPLLLTCGTLRVNCWQEPWGPTRRHKRSNLLTQSAENINIDPDGDRMLDTADWKHFQDMYH